MLTEKENKKRKGRKMQGQKEETRNSGMEDTVSQTPDAVGKAVAIIKPVHPYSPRKRKAVLMK